VKEEAVKKEAADVETEEMIAAVVVEIEEITAAEAEETGDNLKMWQPVCRQAGLKI
jgi:hypothetical protein